MKYVNINRAGCVTRNVARQSGKAQNSNVIIMPQVTRLSLPHSLYCAYTTPIVTKAHTVCVCACVTSRAFTSSDSQLVIPALLIYVRPTIDYIYKSIKQK